MGDCVRIEEYRRTCANCYWHDAAMWACKRPGGWWWVSSLRRLPVAEQPAGEKERRNST